MSQVKKEPAAAAKKPAPKKAAPAKAAPATKEEGKKPVAAAAKKAPPKAAPVKKRAPLRKRVYEPLVLNPYTQKCLQAGGKPRDFFNDISYTINLRSLYKLHDTQYFSEEQQSEYFVHVLEVAKDLLSNIGAPYLLQTWKLGKKIDEIKMEAAPKLWGYNSKYLFYQPVTKNGAEDQIILKRISDGEILTINKIMNKTVYKYIGYMERPEMLVLGTESEIKIICAGDDEFPGGDCHGEKFTIQTIKPKLPLKGIYPPYLVFETEDSQLDFNELQMYKSGDEIVYEFIQQSEAIPREVPKDQVTKVTFMELKAEPENIIYTVALRQSGAVDLYYNCIRQYSTPTEKIVDISMTPSKIFFQLAETKCLELQHNKESSLSMALATTSSNYMLEVIRAEVAMDFVDLFSNFAIATYGSAQAVVAHDNFFSCFDMLSNKWSAHIKFEERIIHFYHKYTYDGDKEFFYAILANGQIKHFTDDAFESEFFEGNHTIKTDQKNAGAIKGTIEAIYEDSNHHRYSLILSNHDSEMKLYLVVNDFVVKINQHLKEKVEPSSRFIILQGLKHGKQAFLHITDKDIVTYEMSFEGRPVVEEGDDEEKQKQEQEQSQILESGDFSDDDNDFAGDFARDLLYITSDPKRTIKNFRAKCKETTNLNIGTVHDAILYSQGTQQKNIHYILSDRTHLFVFKASNQRFYVKKEAYVQRLVHFTYEDNYVLQKGPTAQECGLFDYNINDIIQKVNDDSLKTLRFTQISVGLNKSLYYNIDADRIGYLNSLCSIRVIPLLHINFIKFLGISKPHKYLVYKVTKDVFTALNVSGKLQTWNMITGKLMYQQELEPNEIANLKKYTNYSTQGQEKLKENKALLISKEPWKEAQIKNYFSAHQLTPNLENQRTYMQNAASNIYHHIYIEIVDPQKINTVFGFYHPHYDYQFFYFNNSVKEPKMITRLSLERMNVYQGKYGNNNHIQWSLIKRIDDFDSGFEGVVRDYLPFFSPDFSQHISLNRKENKFQIRDTVTSKLIKDIPSDILEYDSQDKPVNVINRVLFQADGYLRVVSLDGIEKLVDTNNFSIKQNGYNVISFFKKFDLNEGFDHSPYFLERKAYPVHDTESWLARKIQQYKSQQKLFGKRGVQELGQVLYTVERQHMQYACLSFTYLHWSLMDQVGQGQIDVSDINENQIQQMLFNIIPQGNTCLHLFAGNDQPDDLQEIYKLSQPNPSNLSDIVYHAPILKNFSAETALHLALAKNDVKAIDLMLRYLKGYGLDDHSKEIGELIPQFIAKDIPEIGPYLESRMLQTKQIKKISKARLRDDYPEINPIELWYNNSAYETTYIDPAPDQIDKRVQCHFIDLPQFYHYNQCYFDGFFNSLAETENFDIFSVKTIQKLIEFNFPLVRMYTIRKLLLPFVVFLLVFVVYFNAFMENFIDMREYRDIYNNEESWLMSAEFKDKLGTLYHMGEDIVSQVIVGDDLIGYNVTVSDEPTLLTGLMDENFKEAALVTLGFCLSLFLFASYFFFNEVMQMKEGGALTYLSQIWNYIDILPPIGIYISIALLLLNLPSTLALERSVQAITSFFMWMKLLYFMRIFSNTGYLIRMIIVVIKDMRSFLLVLVIGLVAFGSTFLCIARANEEVGATVFTTGLTDSIIYVYNIILGGFDTGEYEDSIAYGLVMTLFLLCTIFNMIVMLNLLIAIISESFANVNSNASQAGYQEMACLISENSYMIPAAKKVSYAKQGKHLMVMTDMEAAENEFSDPVITHVNETKEEMLADIQQFMLDIEEFSLNHQKVMADITNEQAESKKDMQKFFKMIDSATAE